MQITKISNQNSLINFRAITLQRNVQRNIQKQLNSAWQNFSLPNKPIKKVLNGPQGHPYTGRDIPNKGDLPKNGIIDKIKKVEAILTDNKGITNVLKESTEKITTSAKGVGNILKEGISRFFEDVF